MGKKTKLAVAAATGVGIGVAIELTRGIWSGPSLDDQILAASGNESMHDANKPPKPTLLKRITRRGQMLCGFDSPPYGVLRDTVPGFAGGNLHAAMFRMISRQGH